MLGMCTTHSQSAYGPLCTKSARPSGCSSSHAARTGAAAGAPALSPDMMAQLSSPETIAMVQKMMGDMPAEDMAATMRQAGVNITPEQAEQMQQQVCWSVEASCTYHPSHGCTKLSTTIKAVALSCTG